MQEEESISMTEFIEHLRIEIKKLECRNIYEEDPDRKAETAQEIEKLCDKLRFLTRMTEKHPAGYETPEPVVLGGI